MKKTLLCHFFFCSEHDRYHSILIWHWLRWRNLRWLHFFLLCVICCVYPDLMMFFLLLVILCSWYSVTSTRIPGLNCSYITSGISVFPFDLQSQISASRKLSSLLSIDSFPSEEFGFFSSLEVPLRFLLDEVYVVCPTHHFSLSVFI